jgi:hypothetical protein
MLTENTIAVLLQRLKEDHEYLICLAQAYEAAVEKETRTSASILSEYEFAERLAKDRDREAVLALAASPEMNAVVSERRVADANLAEAKANLEITREAISLWRALAYQTSGYPR